MKSVYLEIDGEKVEKTEPTISDLYNFQDLNEKVADKHIVLDKEVFQEMQKMVALYLGIPEDKITGDMEAAKITQAYRNLRDNIYECFIEANSKNAVAPAKK